MIKLFSTIFAAAIMVAAPAFAHHPMGGAVPGTMLQGLLSGIGHPIIGVDHLAFVLGIGLLAAFQQARLVLPAGFIAGTALGTLLIVGGVVLPMVEVVIGLSVLLIGGLVMAGRRLGAGAALLMAAGAGLFHGWAYGEAVIGAETTPIIAYVAAFSVTQFGIALGAMLLALAFSRKAEDGYPAPALQPRLAGAMIAGIGLAFVAETAEALLLAGI
ncbi:HupE/UreJ family protein [Alphaproteobacteria bacterium LSUCC0684]